MIEKRHVSLGLTDRDVLEMYKLMLFARRFDERLWLLNRAGKIPFVISCQGQEAAQVGAAFALDQNVDYLAPYYRDTALVFGFGMTAKEVMLASFGKAEDPNSGGRQMPSHFGHRKKRIITGSSPVSTQIPHAAGFAFAAKIKKENFVTFVTLGDGSTNQGDFHEGLNFAGVHQLPLITFVQNNKLAISVPFEKQIASENIAIRAQAYGMHGVEVDGQDPLAVYFAVKNARTRALNNEGPTLIEAVTERMTSHSSDDNDRTYRTEAELTAAMKNDCNVLFASYLKDIGLLTQEIEQQFEAEIASEIEEATEYAENALYPDPSTLYDYVYEQ